MQNTGNLNTLAERMRAKTEQDRQEIETLTRQQFSVLQQSLSESSKNALSTTEAAILSRLSALEKSVASRCGILTWMFGKRLLQALLLSFALFLSLTLGCWGLIRWETSRILDLRRETLELRTAKDALEKTIASWPLTLQNAPNGRFIVPTPPHTLKAGWTFEGQTAWKLE